MGGLEIVNEDLEVCNNSSTNNLATESTLVEVSSNAENAVIELTAQTSKINEIAESTKKLADESELLNKVFTHTDIEGVGKTIQIDYKTLADVDVRRELITFDIKGNVLSIIHTLPPYAP